MKHQIVLQRKMNIEFPLDKPTESILKILKGYNKYEIESIITEVENRLTSLLVCQ